jgi:serine protease AprX
MKLRSLVPALAAALLLSTFFSSVADAGLLSKLLTPPKLTQTGESRVHPQLRLGLTHADTSIRVIVKKTDSGTLNSVLALLVGGRVIEDFPFIDAFVLELPLSKLPLLGNDSRVGYISPDGAILRQDAPDGGTGALTTAYPATVGATQAWTDPSVGATGQGVTVAVIDTGVSNTHPDLAGRVTQVSVASSATGDIHGHGTHVAGIIAGNDPAGAYRGIAPDASIIGVRIANDAGVARESDLIRGLEWVYNNRATYNIRIVNLSVTAAVPSSYLTSPTSAAAERVWRSGVVVVVASGNDGASADAGWHAPANDPYVITVGCTDDNGTTFLDDDSTCSFSSRGTTIEGQSKPDIAAPGRRIVSALTAPNAILAQTFPLLLRAERRGNVGGREELVSSPGATHASSDRAVRGLERRDPDRCVTERTLTARLARDCAERARSLHSRLAWRTRRSRSPPSARSRSLGAGGGTGMATAPRPRGRGT